MKTIHSKAREPELHRKLVGSHSELPEVNVFAEISRNYENKQFYQIWHDKNSGSRALIRKRVDPICELRRRMWLLQEPLAPAPGKKQELALSPH